MEAHNSPKEIEIRKCISHLRMTSNGVMIFALWSFMKSIIYYATGNSSFTETGEGSAAAGIAGFFLFTVIDLLFRMRIWRGAHREADGSGKRKNRYIIYTMMLLLGGLLIILINIFIAVKYGTGAGRCIVQIIIEISSMSVSFELLRSAFRLRKLRADSAG